MSRTHRIFPQFIRLLSVLLLTGISPIGLAVPFYTGTLWDAHSHVEEGSTNYTRASKIAGAIDGDPTATLPLALPGAGRIMLFPKICLDSYMLGSLATAPALKNRLIPAVGFQNKPTDTLCTTGGWKDYDTSTGYVAAADQFLNDVEVRAASGQYQWLGEVALYGQLGESTEVKAELFNSVIRNRILRVLEIAANSGLPVTFHHTVTDTAGGAIGDHSGSTTNETAAHRFLDILQEHVNNAGGTPAKVVWAHWGGLSSPTDIQNMINNFPNLYFDLAWFHRGLSAAQNRVLLAGCDIDHLAQCEFTTDWKTLINGNPGRFLAGVDAGTNSDYDPEYHARELILRTALGSLDAAVAPLVAAGNLQQLLGVTSAPADGDITLDGTVDAADLLLGEQVLDGPATLSPVQFKHGDVAPLASGTPAPDNAFTPGDLLVIGRKALGEISY